MAALSVVKGLGVAETVDAESPAAAGDSA